MFNVTVGGVTTIICIHTVCSVIIIIIIIIILYLLSAVLWSREAGHYDPSDRGLGVLNPSKMKLPEPLNS